MRPRSPFLCSQFLALSFSFLCFGAVHRSSAQSDNFDDGNDNGWTQLSPLSGFGAGGTWSFPGGNSYRIQAPPSPNEDKLGPARAGSYREDATYTDFYVSVDLIDWDAVEDQNIGILARMSQPGLGTLDGYAATCNPFEGKFYVSIILDEATDSNILDGDLVMNNSEDYRLVFQGDGMDLRFDIFNLTDLLNPIATLETSDPTYTDGFCGIFSAVDTHDIPHSVDVTFDNYVAAAAEPVAVGITDFQIVDDMVTIEFLSKIGRNYSIETTDDPASDPWIEETDLSADNGDRTTASFPASDDPRRFYRVRTLE